MIGAERIGGRWQRGPYVAEVECKSRKTISGAEVARLVKPGRPVAVHVLRQGKFVAVDLDDYLDLIAEVSKRG